jgi:4-hydroxy-2-oxovalerate aldolase
MSSSYHLGRETAPAPPTMSTVQSAAEGSTGGMAGVQVTVLDSTLRDGSHAVRHQFTVEQAGAVAAGLERAGVPVIEVSHGDGLGGSSLVYGLSGTSEEELIAAAVRATDRTAVAVLLLPGIGVRHDLDRAQDLGASVARIATHCTEADIARVHLEHSRERGLLTVGFLMMAHMTSPADLGRQAALMADAGAQVVYVTDSAGAMLPGDVASRVLAIREATEDQVLVGIHAHHNLGLAVANSLAAVQAGARWVDACGVGLGAGAGNAPLEMIAASFERAGIGTGIDVMAALDLAEDVVRPIMTRPVQGDRPSILLGYAGVYGSFLIHAERAAEQFKVPVADILIEIGQRKAVGGQEDMILEVAAMLAQSGLTTGA